MRLHRRWTPGKVRRRAEADVVDLRAGPELARVETDFPVGVIRLGIVGWEIGRGRWAHCGGAVDGSADSP